MKIINHIIEQSEQINTPNGRRYRTPNGDIYPSVTTVLASIENNFLKEWIRKVGEVEAKRIGDSAALRGSKIHAAAESYINSTPYKFSMFEQTEQRMFEQLIPALNQLDEVHACEQRLWSDRLRVAGTVDCVGKIGDEFFIVDFKTSRRYKTREEIDSYFMQCAAYAVAWWERTGIAVKNIRILITTEDDGLLVYDANVLDWVPKFVSCRKTFSSL